ncbi:MAG: hypothetical protein ACYTGN_07845 [Planctomycetota bacterium]|jgi:hypothetical protein
MRSTILALLLVAAACGLAPSKKEEAKADYGQPISQAAAQAQATSFLAQDLKDTPNFKVKWTTLRKGWLTKPAGTGTGNYFGYMIDGAVTIQPKDEKEKPKEPLDYSFLFFNGKLMAVSSLVMVESDYGDPIPKQMVREIAADPRE